MKRFKVFTAAVMVMGCILCFSTCLWAGESGKVNINTASAEELAGLNRIGLKTAARIIEYRDSVGRFNAPEELMNVKGIGEKLFDLNRDRIIVEGNDAPERTGDGISQSDASSGSKG